MFYGNFELDKPGRWQYRFVGTGAAAGANEGTFLVYSLVEDALDILNLPGDFDAIRALLGVTEVDLKDYVILLTPYGPMIESRVKEVVPDWATLVDDPIVAPRLRTAVAYGIAATLAESYMKGGTVSLVQREEPRRNWSEWARILWNRYREALARVTSEGSADDIYLLTPVVVTGPSRTRGTAPDWTGIYPPVWPET